MDELSGLRPAGPSLTIRGYLGDLWATREFALRVPRDTLRAQHANTVLGNLWLLLNPILQIAVYYLIFGVVLGVDRGVENFVAFLAVGVFIFQFSSRSAIGGSKSIITNTPLIKAISFPRALLPLTTVVEQALAHFPAAVVMLLVALMTGEPVRWSWIALVPLFVLQFFCNLGIAFLLARATHTFYDLQHFLPFVFRLLFYGSGVLFLVDEYVQGAYVYLFVLNPFYCFISMNRWAVLDMAPSGPVLLASMVLSLLSLVVGGWYFVRGENSYGRG